ncbi:GCN5 family acetyltransferase [Mycobacterium florentinum]|uniref:GCN5 family acetyltransferase n=1 Tax=Mycobacterium florentinum TaxID=292462 RepID=A0A1X1U6Z3_MYCFL|nr:GNAT family N-acetyltransferase [Mycobacterium florentinum]MCV7409764.1 GNAT family N-acetyltransferase [Mycobacterium florentinum]ORV52573.1 GCN5 family acetyltransferase [Mycobacterium florentinum]BBX79062.1 GCN5-like N-acetyltransferase [Mycobacterium florentinum]
MVSWPDLGTRVTVRYRRRPGSVPPLTDAVGHLLAVDPMVRVQTKTGAVAEFAAADVVALRVLTDAPVRTSQIRALEHAAATARPGTEQAWLNGWLLRAADDGGVATNSAVPLDISARLGSVPAIVAWYDQRALTPVLAIPERLLTPPRTAVADHTERVLVRDMADYTAAEIDPAVTDAAVTNAPDGTRWVGLSAPREELLAGGARRGATRAYLVVAEHDTGTASLAESLGFRLHHRRRYFEVRSSAWDTV